MLWTIWALLITAMAVVVISLAVRGLLGRGARRGDPLFCWSVIASSAGWVIASFAFHEDSDVLLLVAGALIVPGAILTLVRARSERSHPQEPVNDRTPT